ncbi:MAG: hypothetical protein LUG47_08680, partial [Clostridiales bacterium]|nr:hypothetical protein [Clostridiales bacterium]
MAGALQSVKRLQFALSQTEAVLQNGTEIAKIRREKELFQLRNASFWFSVKSWGREKTASGIQ